MLTFATYVMIAKSFGRFSGCVPRMNLSRTWHFTYGIVVKRAHSGTYNYDRRRTVIILILKLKSTRSGYPKVPCLGSLLVVKSGPTMPKVALQRPILVVNSGPTIR